MNTSTTRVPTAVIATVALLALTGCGKSSTPSSTGTVPHCTAVRTAGGDLVPTSDPRPCLLTTTTPSSSPTPSTTATDQYGHGRADAPTKAAPAPGPAPDRKPPAAKSLAPVAKVPPPAAPAPVRKS
ncbi:hypothetical protein [Streptomyces sp. NPDC007346]|uniref:hypothetical protein n=1 Tax=Streptomyces sp. NPDC007346 TaxID=3154682 RepID=UPI003455EBB8